MPTWLETILEKSSFFMPHGHCYLWIPSLLWLHVLSDLLIGIAYLGISVLLYMLVRRIRLPFSPVFIAFGLFIGLCGLTHFMSVWTVWNPDYFVDGLLKAATAAASVATAIGLMFIRPQIEAVVHTARVSEERRIQLESTNAELKALYDRIKELGEQKSQFFANVSHELRTPLTLIFGPAQRMLQDANLTEEQRRQLAIIDRNSKTLLKHVNDLLDVAKLESGNMQVRYAQVNLAAWVKRIASQFEFIAEQRQISYGVVAPDTLAAQVDPDMLERVFINLLSNAFKFTPAGERIEVELTSDDHALQFKVTDSGPGIHPDQHRAIFERFRQADGGATRKHGGTGLGLAIVKDFVDLHGGRVEVHSKPGSGASFVVYVPLRAPQGASVNTRLAEALPVIADVGLETAVRELSDATDAMDSFQANGTAQRPKVLVVEDNTDMRRFLAETLSSDFHVVLAVDGQEGLERALAVQPDLIVTDVMMPRMSGEQLVTELRRRPAFDAVPVLLLTAKVDDELRIRMLQTGAQDYLSKPFQPQELLARAGNLAAMKRTGDLLRTTLASASSDVEGLAREVAIKNRQLAIAVDATNIAREQAERATQVKSHFLAMVSHELRTPISTIHTNTELLRRLSVPGAPELYSRVMERLRRATLQISGLVEGLLEYTRVESGRMALKPESLDVHAMASEIAQAHSDAVPPDVALTLEPATMPLPPIQTDPRLLNVILSNLVSNALKFTSRGAVTLRIRTAGSSHIFEVHDTGVGIAKADLSRIFLPFEQLEPVKRKSIPGMGLGLTLVKQLVNVLGGEVEVQSTEGEGSTFRVVLPSRLEVEPYSMNATAGVARGV